MTLELPGWIPWAIGLAGGFAVSWGQMRLTLASMEKRLDKFIEKAEARIPSLMAELDKK